MSIRKVKLKNGEMKWEVRVHENGRGSRRVTKRFDRKNDAEGFLQELKKEKTLQSHDSYQGISIRDRLFREEAEHWLNDGRLRFSESHIKKVRGILSELMPVYGEFSVNRFTPDLLSKFQQSEKLKGLKNATINRKTEVIAAIMNFSTRQRRIPYNPSAGFRKLTVDKEETVFWNKEEAVAFLSAANDRHPRGTKTRWIYVVYLLALNTGMRAGEIWGLKVKDLSPNQSAIAVRRQFNRVTQTFTPTKGKKARHVPASEELMRELQALIRRGDLGAEDTIFRNREGLPVNHDNFISRLFPKDLRAWRGRPLRFHDLRHTATTLMIAIGIDINTVKEICGHADIHTTMGYVHMLSGSVGAVAKRFSIEPIDSRKEVETAKLKLV